MSTTDVTPLPGGFLDEARVLEGYYPGARSTLHRQVARGEFPAPVKIGGRAYWRVEDVRAWRESLPFANRHQHGVTPDRETENVA